MRSQIPAAEAVELKQLYRRLPPLIWEATNKIKIEAFDEALAGADLERYREANAQVVSIMMQIIDITGR